MLRLVPDLRTYSDPLTAAMVDLYTQSQEQFLANSYFILKLVPYLNTKIILINQKYKALRSTVFIQRCDA